MTSAQRTLFALSLLLNVVALGALAWQRTTEGDDAIREERFVASRASREESFFEALPLTNEDIVFVGDSLVAEGRWQELFPEAPIKNRGIGGDTSTDVLERLPQITDASPAAIFVAVGTNDLAEEPQNKIIAANIESVLRQIREESPESSIYLNAVLPREPAASERIVELNGRLEAVAGELGATWIDLYPAFADETGGLRAELTNDALHLNGDGYLLWRDRIAQHIAPRPTEGSVHRAIFFEPKAAAGSDEEREFLELSDWLAAQPGVEAFRRVAQLAEASPLRHGVLMRFADRTAYDAYLNSPERIRFVEEAWRPGVRSAVELDFVDAPGQSPLLAPAPATADAE